MEKDIGNLLARYPIRETKVLSNITKALGLTRIKYESSVRKLIIDNDDIKKFYRNLLEPLTSLIIESQNTEQVRELVVDVEQ